MPSTSPKSIRRASESTLASLCSRALLGYRSLLLPPAVQFSSSLGLRTHHIMSTGLMTDLARMIVI